MLPFSFSPASAVRRRSLNREGEGVVGERNKREDGRGKEGRNDTRRIRKRSCFCARYSLEYIYICTHQESCLSLFSLSPSLSCCVPRSLLHTRLASLSLSLPLFSVFPRVRPISRDVRARECNDYLQSVVGRDRRVSTVHRLDNETRRKTQRGRNREIPHVITNDILLKLTFRNSRGISEKSSIAHNYVSFIHVNHTSLCVFSCIGRVWCIASSSLIKSGTRRFSRRWNPSCQKASRVLSSVTQPPLLYVSCLHIDPSLQEQARNTLDLADSDNGAAV